MSDARQIHDAFDAERDGDLLHWLMGKEQQPDTSGALQYLAQKSEEQRESEPVDEQVTKKLPSKPKTPEEEQKEEVQKVDAEPAAPPTYASFVASNEMPDDGTEVSADFIEAQERQAIWHRIYRFSQQREQFIAARKRANASDHVTNPTFDIPRVVDLVEQHDVTFVCTETGSGKTTRIPLELLRRNRNKPDFCIVSAQPRRTATISIATYVAQLLQQKVGDEVGYWIRGAKVGDTTDGSTSLWYMTSYTLLLQLMSENSRLLETDSTAESSSRYSHIILDEFHERQPDVEVSAALVRLAMQVRNAAGASCPKLILMSATLELQDWQEYFTNAGLSVAVYHQGDAEFPVETFLKDDIFKLLGFPCQPFGPEASEVSDVKAVPSQALRDSMTVTQHLLYELHASLPVGCGFLVFLPGRVQVEQFVEWASQTFGQCVEAIAWHSAVDVAVIQRLVDQSSIEGPIVLKPLFFRGRGNRRETTMSSSPLRRRIYFSTDIAEVSVTIPDVVVVIDLGFLKRPVIDVNSPASITYPPLGIHFCSKSNIIQRRGRVGRLQPGMYFCLLDQTRLRNLPPPLTPMENSRVNELALHLLQVTDNPAMAFAICHHQPNAASVGSSMTTLRDLGCIVEGDTTNTEMFEAIAVWKDTIYKAAHAEITERLSPNLLTLTRYHTSFLGRLLQLLPLSVHQGLLVYFGFLCGMESVMILAAATASSSCPFVSEIANDEMIKRHAFNRQQRGKEDPVASASQHMKETEMAMRLLSGGTNCDVMTAMRVVLSYRSLLQKHSGKPSEKLQRIWANAHRVALDRLKTIDALDRYIHYELNNFVVSYRIVKNPRVLTEQLNRIQPAVIACIATAFASQALIVTSGYGYKEGGRGIFSTLDAHPDLHVPSTVRWNYGDIIVPIQLSLNPGHHLLASIATAMSTSIFLESILLLSQSIQWLLHHSTKEENYIFAVSHNDTRQVMKTSVSLGKSILAFRKRLQVLHKSLLLIHLFQNSLNKSGKLETNELLKQHGIQRSLLTQQNQLLRALSEYFFTQTTSSSAEKEIVFVTEKREKQNEEHWNTSELSKQI